MKKGSITLVSILAIILILIIVIISAFISGYNGLTEKKTEVESAMSSVKVYLQRRADLIPNFVKTVKGYSDYESKTYTAVTEARAQVGKAGNVSEQSAASEQLDKAIDVWVNAVTENYPDLKANSNYQALLDELEGSENRISTARNDYNSKVEKYNKSVAVFPTNIVASMFGFEKAEYFEISEGAQEVPEVSFD